jgi:NAD dependent epimerase/dehydratase
MKLLVTGADGFIGSHLTEALVRAGHEVRAFVQYNSFNSWGWLDDTDSEVVARMKVIAGDIRDPNQVAEAVMGCDGVLHLAALIAIPFSYHAPDAYIDTNVKGTLNVLQAARRHGVGKLIHTSTSEVYGTARSVPITEEHPLQAQSPYAATKIAADVLALSFHASFGLPVCVVRPFNTFGPRQSARAVIPTVISQIASGKKRVRLGSLHPTRDFNYVSDTVRGFIAALESNEGIGQVVNFGSSFEISIGDLAHLIAEVMDADISVELDENRVRPSASEVDRLCAANDKARRLFGWSPEFAGRDGLRQGLARTVAWFKEPRNLARYRPETYNV